MPWQEPSLERLLPYPETLSERLDPLYSQLKAYLTQLGANPLTTHPLLNKMLETLRKEHPYSFELHLLVFPQSDQEIAQFQQELPAGATFSILSPKSDAFPLDCTHLHYRQQTFLPPPPSQIEAIPSILKEQILKEFCR